MAEKESADGDEQEVVDKAQLYESFRRRLCDPNNDPDAPYRSVYWSPSGGTTGTSLHVPVDDAENDLQRASLVPILLAGGVYSAHTIDANLFDTGRGGFLYRAQEIFKDFVTQCQGTSLPLGWHCADQVVVQRCLDFRANSISASPSRMALLAGHVLSRLKALQQEQQTTAPTASKDELDALNKFRFRVTRGVFACEPLHNAREDLIRSAFPRIEFASVMGGAEVGCWGVSLPIAMPNDAFLYDKRVVSVRVVHSQEEAETTSSCTSGSVGRLMVTNHLRERFPVKNYDTGDLGSVVPACSVCADDHLLQAVENFVRDGMQMREWSQGRQRLAAPNPLLGCVSLTSRASSLVGGQFNAYTHTLNAFELIQKAETLVNETQGGAELGAYVNGQVVVWFNKGNGGEELNERVDIRLLFANMDITPSLVKKIGEDATLAMQDWIMFTLSKKDLAEAISITITHTLETSETASNQNKIPLLRDLRDQKADKDKMTQTSFDALMPTEARAVASNDSGLGFDSSLAITTDGLHSKSAWIGAFQASPAPLWDLPSSMVRSAHAGLAQELRDAVPANLLARVPPKTWAPYPFAMTLPLYDATIELSANLRKAVKALLSSRGLALLRSYYEDGGVAGGLAVPAHISSLLFAGVYEELSAFSVPPIIKPIPIGERNMSEASKMSSIDLGWSRTLLERDLSGVSRAPSSRVPAEKGTESWEEDQEFDPISHLGIVEDQDYPSSNIDWDVSNRTTDKVKDSDSILTQGLVFWRPDFLFDLEKVNRCASCTLSFVGATCETETSNANSDCKTSDRPWPPSSRDARRKVGRRSSTAPPVSVCEINARFTVNGFAMSAFGVDASKRMLLRKQPSENDGKAKSPTDWSALGLAPVHRLAVMQDEIRKRISSPHGCPTWLVKGREKGYDCHAMENLLGISPVQDVTPSELSALLDEWFDKQEILTSAETSCHCPNCPNHTIGASIDSFECESVCPSHRGGSSCTLLIFLELHQDEIALLPPSTLHYLTGLVPATRNCCCRSPVRVLTSNPLSALFLLHDKRTLSVLGDRKLMEGLVGSRAARILADAIVPTVPVSDWVRATAWKADPRVRAAVRETFDTDMNPFKSPSLVASSAGTGPPNWMLDVLLKAVCDQSKFVLKRSQSGKGAGMVYGEEVSRSTWLKTLFDSASGSYVLQPYVDQATFPCILSAESKGAQRNVEDCTEPLCQPLVCHVVGCLPFLGEGSFGPGIFRASAAGPHPVSVTGGGAILLPALKMDDSSLARRAPRWPICSADSFCLPTNEQRSEHILLANLRKCSATWKNCGDCALRDQTFDAGVSDNLRDHCYGLLFYSGVSVLACREPEILTQLRQMKLIESGRRGLRWIMVSVPPTTFQLDEAKEMLSRHGVCVWRANNAVAFDSSSLDDSSIVNEELLRVTQQLGGKPMSHYTLPTGEHDGTCYAWDISPCCSSPARSHNAQAFSMHTDASFEDDPPTHILLHVLSQDVLGGGLSRLLSGAILLRVLSPAMRSLLSRQDYVFQIPAEFKEEGGQGVGPRVVKQSILMIPSYRWRFRSDIVSGPHAPHSVRHLEHLLRTPSLSARMRLVPGSVMLLDNGRYFHARSEVMDESRWLKRVRFSLDEPDNHQSKED